MIGRYVATAQEQPRAADPSNYRPTMQAPATNLFVSAYQALLDMLERIGHGGMVLDRAGDVAAVNKRGRDLLTTRVRHNPGSDETIWLRHSAQRLLDRATPWFPRDREAWVTVPCGDSRPLALHWIPLARSQGKNDYVLIVLTDIDAAPSPNPATLRRIFGLTGAETKLAIQIMRGETPASIANVHGISMATVRSQLASIFSKTQTRRQVDLAMLLTRLAILP